MAICNKPCYLALAQHAAGVSPGRSAETRRVHRCAAGSRSRLGMGRAVGSERGAATLCAQRRGSQPQQLLQGTPRVTVPSGMLLPPRMVPFPQGAKLRFAPFQTRWVLSLGDRSNLTFFLFCVDCYCLMRGTIFLNYRDGTDLKSYLGCLLESWVLAEH